MICCIRAHTAPRSLPTRRSSDIYDGSAHPATGFAYGVGGTSDVLIPAVTFTYYSGTTASGTPLSGPPVDAGTYTVRASYAGSTNYTSAYKCATITIEKATPTVNVTWTSYTYDGSAHPASGFAYGVGGVSDVLSPAATFSYQGTGSTTTRSPSAPPADAGTYPVRASYAGSTNYTSAYKCATITIEKATPTVNVTWTSYTYDGTAHPATGFAYGVGGTSD